MNIRSLAITLQKHDRKHERCVATRDKKLEMQYRDVILTQNITLNPKITYLRQQLTSLVSLLYFRTAGMAKTHLSIAFANFTHTCTQHSRKKASHYSHNTKEHRCPRGRANHKRNDIAENPIPFFSWLFVFELSRRASISRLRLESSFYYLSRVFSRFCSFRWARLISWSQ